MVRLRPLSRLGCRAYFRESGQQKLSLCMLGCGLSPLFPTASYTKETSRQVPAMQWLRLSQYMYIIASKLYIISS